MKMKVMGATETSGVRGILRSRWRHRMLRVPIALEADKAAVTVEQRAAHIFVISPAPAAEIMTNYGEALNNKKESAAALRNMGLDITE